MLLYILNSNVNTCLTPFVVQESHEFKGKNCKFSYNSTTFLFFLAAFGCFWKTKTYLTRGRHCSFPKDSTKTESPSRLSACSADGPALAKLGLALRVLLVFGNEFSRGRGVRPYHVN